MLLLLLVAAYSLPRTFVTQSAWEGTVTIDEGGCVDGDVVLMLSGADRDGVTEGVYHYESRGHRNGWYEADYTMNGSWDGPWLHLTQAGIDVTVEKQSTNWCFGEMDLRDSGRKLKGRWTAQNCGCAGDVVLRPR
ncbi:MAG: hypothetical protein GY913_26695 [Proteobacteria bacterium]|nr:hypothetical protein [Pseudomonadota bacterium]MCP4920505.1 hypothetical protein [Pseudomonadota bacterium]